HGRHSLKFGGAVERMQLNLINLINPSGLYSFGSLANFLSNKPKRLQVLLPKTNSPFGLRQTLVGIYAQDDWRARSNLTVNMGLRWEMITLPSEVHGRLAHL